MDPSGSRITISRPKVCVTLAITAWMASSMPPATAKSRLSAYKDAVSASRPHGPPGLVRARAPSTG